MDVEPDKNLLTFEGKWFTLCTHSYCVFDYKLCILNVAKNNSSFYFI